MESGRRGGFLTMGEVAAKCDEEVSRADLDKLRAPRELEGDSEEAVEK
jgi:hypothetical protein